MYKFLMFFLIVLSSCISMKKNISIDNLVIYSLPMYKLYFLPIDCNELKNHKDVKVSFIKDKSVINEYFSVLSEDSCFVIDTTMVFKSDAKVVFEFRKRNKIIYEICWEHPCFIRREGDIFRYDDNIRELLIKNGHIWDVIIGCDTLFYEELFPVIKE